MTENQIKLKVKIISQGSAFGKIIYFDPKKSKREYNHQIVVLHDLNASEFIPELKNAAGLIAEIGGITSHGSVLAREYKLPCLLLPEAKKILENGQEVIWADDGFIVIKGLKAGLRPKETALSKPIKYLRKGKWVLIKPGAEVFQTSKFLEEFMLAADTKAAKVLLGKTVKPKTKTDKAGIWMSDYFLPTELVDKILKNPKWFWQKTKQQKSTYTKLKKYNKILAGRIQSGLSVKQAVFELKKTKEWYVEIMPYILLIGYSVDIIENDFYEMASSFLSPKLSAELFDGISRSNYAKKIVQDKIAYPRLPKRIYFPPAKIKIIEAMPAYGRKVKLKKEVVLLLNKKSKTFQKKFLTYLEVLPTMVEINDEICYVTRVLFSALIPGLMKIIADFLIKHRAINKSEEVFDHTIKELIALVKSFEITSGK